MMLSRLSALVLGPTGRKRFPVLMSVLTFVMYGLFYVPVQFEVQLGFMSAQVATWLMTYCLLGSLVFYILVRSGLSERISSDQSLMSWQMVHAVLGVAWAYSNTGPTRGALMPVLVLILAYGLFSLDVRRARLLALFSATVLTATVGWMCYTDPANYVPDVELVYLAFEWITLLGISALSVRMGALRDHMRRQKLALEESLKLSRGLAMQDELTGLANRRHMLSILKAEHARQQRTEQPLSLVLLDLDHFKRVNDTYGHLAGDGVLKSFADATSSTLRSSDVLSRWGGEEFLLLLPETAAQEAELCVERMRQCLAKGTFDSVEPNLKVTFSAGLSICRPGVSLEAAIERADKALYRAKAQGRNCTLRA
jgi:diguanylate cyclase (GGDEF)-like protein